MRLFRNGFSLVPILVLVGVTLLGLGFGVTFGFIQPAGIGLPDISQLLQRNVPDGDFSFIDDPLLRQHFARQAATTDVRAVTSLDQQSSFYTETQLEDGGYRFRAWQLVDGRITGELMDTGQSVYVKDYQDGSWWVQDRGSISSNIPSQYQPKIFREELLAKTNLTYTTAGEDACGQALRDMSCHVYIEQNPLNTFASRTLWFDVDALLLRREEVAFGELTTVTEYSYDDISILPPSNTKDVGEDQDVYALVGSDMTSTAVRQFSDIVTTAVVTGVPIQQDVAFTAVQTRLEEELERRLNERLQERLNTRLQDQLNQRLQDQLNQQLQERILQTQ